MDNNDTLSMIITLLLTIPIIILLWGIVVGVGIIIWQENVSDWLEARRHRNNAKENSQ